MALRAPRPSTSVSQVEFVSNIKVCVTNMSLCVTNIRVCDSHFEFVTNIRLCDYMRVCD